MNRKQWIELAPVIIAAIASLFAAILSVGFSLSFRYDNLTSSTPTSEIMNPLTNPNGDADGDGLLNFIDSCPLEPGSALNSGCPSLSTNTPDDPIGISTEFSTPSAPRIIKMELYIEAETFTLIILDSNDYIYPISLIDLNIEVNIEGINNIIYLKDFFVFNSINLSNLEPPLCLILTSEGVPPSRNECSRERTIIQYLGEDENFWFDNKSERVRNIIISKKGLNSQLCVPGEGKCEIEY